MNKWDKYYFNICTAVADNSSCLSRKIGAIIVRDKSIISTGYNGPPRGIPHCGARNELKDQINYFRREHWLPDVSDFELANTCPRQLLGYKSGEGLHLCPAGHAERNAIVNAAREGIAIKDTKMYMSCPIPCSPCLVEIINAGISEIIVVSMNYYDTLSKYLIEESGIKIRTYEWQ